MKDGVILDKNGNPFTAPVRSTGRPSTLDFVITESGELRIGKGHDFLSDNAASVKGAGTIRIQDGKIIEVTNDTGHFKTNEAELKRQAELLDAYGVTTQDRNVTTRVPDSRNPRMQR